MWLEPEELRQLDAGRKRQLVLKGRPETSAEVSALRSYERWLSGPGLLAYPGTLALIGLAAILILTREPLAVVVAPVAAFVVILGLMLRTRRQVRKHLDAID